MIIIAMIISIFPVMALAKEYSDMPNNWSTDAIKNAVANGLLNGNNGKIRAEDNLTRAEMATVVNRAFGAKEKALINQYSDVYENAWYYSEMAKAVKMGTFIGNENRLNPDNQITREQAFIVLARAFKLSSTGGSSLNPYFDKNEVSNWAKEGVDSLLSAGYIAGSDNKLNPKKYITRAEFAKVMDNLVKTYINKEGTYIRVNNGNVMVNVPNVKLKDLTINGDLIIGDGVGNGDITLLNVKVTGRILIRGIGAKIIEETTEETVIEKDTQDDLETETGGGVGNIDGETKVDLTDYNKALASVLEVNYTADSWAIYQGVVKANSITTKSSQAEVDAATKAIIVAQTKLIKKSQGPALAMIEVIQANVVLGYDKIKVTLNVDNPEKYKVKSSALSEFLYNNEDRTFIGVAKTGTTAEQLFITQKETEMKVTIVSMIRFLMMVKNLSWKMVFLKENLILI